MYKWSQVLVQDLDENVDENFKWESCMANSKGWRSERYKGNLTPPPTHTQSKCDWTLLWSNKKVATPPFLHQPPPLLFQVYPPFLPKNFVPPPPPRKWPIFFEGHSPTSLIRGEGFRLCVVHHESVNFFFLIYLWTCFKSLNGINSLHYFMWFLLFYLLHLFSSDCFASLTGL